MKHLRTLTLLTAVIAVTTLKAQTDSRHDATTARPDSADAPALLTPCADSLGLALPLPVFDIAAPGFYGLNPWSAGLGDNSWRLHEGFNASLSMSLTAGLGKNAPSGVGFGQTAAFAYAVPLTKRFAAAVGVYADNMTWGSSRQTDGGLAATIRYSVTPAFSVYAYAARSFLPQKNRFTKPCNPFLPPVPKDRFGAMAEFKIGQNAIIQVSVEKQNY